MTASTRPASLGDVDALVELRGQMFTDMGVPADPVGWRPRAREWFARAIDDEDVYVVVIEREGHVVSCGMAELHRGAPAPTCPRGRTVHVSNVVTRPDFRGQGFARQCIAALMTWAEARGDRVELHASPDGVDLYRRLGFEETPNPTMRMGLRMDA